MRKRYFEIRYTKKLMVKDVHRPSVQLLYTIITRLNMQKIHNTYWRNCHCFYSNYIHSKHATRMFMAYAPILPLVSFWQHSIHIQKTISELGTWRQQYPPSKWLSVKIAPIGFHPVKSNCHQSGRILTTAKINHSQNTFNT